MTRKEYEKYAGSVYTTKTRCLATAIKLALNKHNLGKTRIIMLEDGTYGVMQNSLAKRFLAAGYEAYNYGFEVLA